MLTDTLTNVLAVDPVPWARSQMAFTLAFHIILVPLGVSWSAMTLIANYRGIRHGDTDAMLLAQRWSKYMAVTFAVGAVTGTVLSFEFGLLWPKFMGQWGAAFGVPFAFEGIFFFAEAVFISIYIFGWRRLRPWVHFWTGVPIALAGIFGSISVVAANAWMNSPQGVTLDSSGKVTDVDPMGVIFNDAMPLMAAHMVVAAYLVGGFMVASVYAFGMLRGRTDRYHRMGFIIGFTVAAIATPVQMGVGDALARWVYNEQPTKFAAIEMVTTTSDDVPEVLFGHLNSEGEVVGGIPIPGLASILSDPGKGTSTVIEGLDETPAEDRPSNHEVNVTHLAWDLMVGLGTLLFLLTLWWWASWIFRRDMPRSKWFLRASAASGVLAVITLEAGWTVSEVGRQPWIVYEKMKVEDAATANTGIWITFIGVVLLYVGLGITTILVLRRMSRRFREGDRLDDDRRSVRAERAGHRDRLGRRRESVARMSTTAAVILFAAITMYSIFGGADFGAGFWDLVAGGTKRGKEPREVIDHSIAPVWEANHVWLIFVFVVLWTCFPEAYASITLTLFVPLTLAALGIVLRGASFAFRKAVFRTRDRRNFGAAFAVSSVLVPYCLGAVVGGIASGRVPSGGKAGDPWDSWVNPTSVLGGVLAVCVTAYLAAFFLVRDADRLSDAAMVAYFRRRAIAAAVAAGLVSLGGIVVLSNDADYLFDGLTSRALPLVVLSAVAGVVSLVMVSRGTRRGTRLVAVTSVGSLVVAWGVAQWDYLLPTSLTVSQAAAPSGTITAVLVATALAVVLIVPAFVLLYVLDQRTMLPEEGMPDSSLTRGR